MAPSPSCSSLCRWVRQRMLVSTALVLACLSSAGAQDVLTSQLEQGFGKNKVRYRDFQWQVIESPHLQLHYEPEFQALAEQSVAYLEEAYAKISATFKHELSHKPPIVIYQSNYEFLQTNIVHDFLPPGVAGFAEPLRYRMVIPFDGDLDTFKSVLFHELTHIFEYDILYRGPVKRISNPLSSPPTWIMEGLAEYAALGRNTVDEMVLRDAVLTDQLIPLKVMDAAWGTGNVFLAYKQAHSLMEYIAATYGPEKVSRILRLWEAQNDTDRLLKRLLDTDMKTLDERWSAYMRKQYWPLLQTRDYLSELGRQVTRNDESDLDEGSILVNPRWSLSGDMLAVLTSDGVEEHVDVVRVKDGSLVQRLTRGMQASRFDHLTFGEGTLAWSPDGRTIAFVAKRGPRDTVVLWDMYDHKARKSLRLKGIEVIEALDWSPDGRQLALVGTGYGQSDIYVVDVANGTRRQITGSPQRDDFPAWSPDGRRLAFCSKVNGQYDIRVCDLETDEIRTVIASPTDDMWPQWFPEGNKILYVSTRQRINDLFVYHLDEGSEYRLTRTLSGVMNPDLSADGRQIALNTYYHGRNELFVLPVPEWPELKRRSADLAARAPAEAADSTRARPQPNALVVTATTAAAPGPGGGAALGEPVLLAQASGWSETGVTGRTPQAGTGTARAAADSLGPEAAQSVPGRQFPAAADSARARGVSERPSDRLAAMTVTDTAAALPLVALAPAPPASAGPPAAPVPAAADSDTVTAGAPLDPASLPRHPYSPKLQFDGVAVQMGYMDGYLSSIAQLSMSDLLGNHELSLATDYVASQEISNEFNFAVAYNYYGRRPTYQVAAFNWNQYYNADQWYQDTQGLLYRGVVRSQQRGMLANVSYPIDLYRRLDLNYTYVSETQGTVWPVSETGGSISTHLLKAAYVHDSITYGLLGPTHGKRYFLAVGRTLDWSSSTRSFSHLEADHRTYTRLGRWSVLGLRATGVGSFGAAPLEYNLGGPAWFLPFYTGLNLNIGPLRGYDFSEFTGTRVLLLNSEVRVPFIRQVVFGWPGTFAIPAVDGSFFLDVGTAWNDGEHVNWWPLHAPGSAAEPDGERDLRAGMGFGLLVYFVLPMNFEFAKQTDLRGGYSDYRFHFSFGKSF